MKRIYTFFVKSVDNTGNLYYFYALKKNGACEHRPRQTQKNRIMKKLINYNVWR
jgi:hypothetical protein